MKGWVKYIANACNTFFSCVFAIAVVKNSNVFEIVLITLFLDLLILTHFYTAYGNK